LKFQGNPVALCGVAIIYRRKNTQRGQAIRGRLNLLAVTTSPRRMPQAATIWSAGNLRVPVTVIAAILEDFVAIGGELCPEVLRANSWRSAQNEQGCGELNAKASHGYDHSTRGQLYS